MTEQEIIAIARECEEYVFGSAELDILHYKYRRYGRFSETFWYLVFHPGCRGSDSFHTLNEAKYGQQCPVMHDLPAGWRTDPQTLRHHACKPAADAV